MLKLGLQQTDLEQGLGLAAGRQPEGVGAWSRPQPRVCTGRSPGLLLKPNCQHMCKERGGTLPQRSQHAHSRHGSTSVSPGSAQAPVGPPPPPRDGLKFELCLSGCVTSGYLCCSRQLCMHSGCGTPEQITGAPMAGMGPGAGFVGTQRQGWGLG